MSKTKETLARRWMASKHWGGTRDGMVDASPGNEGNLVYGSNIEGVPVTLWQGCGSRPRQRLSPEFLPELDHPGTRAFLLEDVRRAWGCCVVLHPPCTLRPRFWACEVERVDSGVVFWQRFQKRTEAEALIAALEACDG